MWRWRGGGSPVHCPYCRFTDSRVLDSRVAEDGSSIRRRRECRSCAKRFTTYETEESLPMLASDAMLQQRLLVNNPVEVTEADALRLYQEAF